MYVYIYIYIYIYIYYHVRISGSSHAFVKSTLSNTTPLETTLQQVLLQKCAETAA